VPLRRLAALALLLALGGCTQPRPSTPDAAAPTSAPPTAEASAGVGGVGGPASPGPSPALADGKHPAFLTAVDVAHRTVTLDLVEFLTGDAAKKRFQQDHPGEQGPDNDYYVVNDNPLLRTLPVSGQVQVTVAGGDPNQPIGKSFADLPGYVAAHRVLFWLTVAHGEVTKVDQIWLP
jgi:hypothetical protein